MPAIEQADPAAGERGQDCLDSAVVKSEYARSEFLQTEDCGAKNGRQIQLSVENRLKRSLKQSGHS